MAMLLKDIIRPLVYFITNKYQREFYRLHSQLSSKKRFNEIKNLKFLDFVFDIPDGPSFVWQFKDIFVDQVYLFNSKKNDPVIYDCGSNVGLSLLYFSTLYPNAVIKGYEADKNLASLSQMNLKKNNISNAIIFPVAIWVDDNGVDFSIEGADGGSIVGGDNFHRTESVRLRSILRSEPHIDLLKLDIEGAEFDVMTDCRDSLSNVQNIFIEYHSFKNDSQKLGEILSILEGANFRYYISEIYKKKSPFTSLINSKKMDLQLNIFAKNNKFND